MSKNKQISKKNNQISTEIAKFLVKIIANLKWKKPDGYPRVLKSNPDGFGFIKNETRGFFANPGWLNFVGSGRVPGFSKPGPIPNLSCHDTGPMLQ